MVIAIIRMSKFGFKDKGLIKLILIVGVAGWLV
jgi:hypothetical protein